MDITCSVIIKIGCEQVKLIDEYRLLAVWPVRWTGEGGEEEGRWEDEGPSPSTLSPSPSPFPSPLESNGLLSGISDGKNNKIVG